VYVTEREGEKERERKVNERNAAVLVDLHSDGHHHQCRRIIEIIKT